MQAQLPTPNLRSTPRFSLRLSRESLRGLDNAAGLVHQQEADGPPPPGPVPTEGCRGR